MPRTKRPYTRTLYCAFCGAGISVNLDDVGYEVVGGQVRKRKVVRCLGCRSENVWHDGRGSLDPLKPSRQIAEKNQDLELRELAAFIRTTIETEAAHRVTESDFAKEARPILATIDSGDRAAAIRSIGEYLQRMGELGRVQQAYLTIVWARRFDGVFSQQKETILAGVSVAVRAEVAAAIERKDWALVEKRLIATERDQLHARAEMVIFQTRDVVAD